MTDSELIDLVRQRHGKVKKSGNGYYYIKCPTCLPRDAVKCKRSFSLETLLSKCWICEIPMHVRELIGLENVERVERTSVEEPEPINPQAINLPCTGYIPINQLDKDHPAIKLFAKDQLVNLDRYWEENEIGFIPKEGAVDLIFPNSKMSPADSLIFPVRYKEVLIGWQLRYVPGTANGDRMHKIRYMHLYKKGNYLYNYDNAKNHNVVIVVEGVKKALKFDNAVATLGKGITHEQIQLLLHWKQIIFMYDSEEKTQEKAKELVTQFNFGGKQALNINPGDFGYPSPDEMSQDVARQIVEDEWNKKYGRSR